jgi:hypothetical protein
MLVMALGFQGVKKTSVLHVHGVGVFRATKSFDNRWRCPPSPLAACFAPWERRPRDPSGSLVLLNFIANHAYLRLAKQSAADPSVVDPRSLVWRGHTRPAGDIV